MVDDGQWTMDNGTKSQESRTNNQEPSIRRAEPCTVILNLFQGTNSVIRSFATSPLHYLTYQRVLLAEVAGLALVVG
jgi:hypothetical protein